MKARDRLVLMVIGALAILIGGWIVVVSPERKQASSLAGQVAQARATLNDAQSKVAAARTAQAQFPAAYASVVRLGKAVPPGDEVASLVYQVAQASDSKSVDFNSIAAGSAAAGASTPATPTVGAPVGAAGFQAKPFTFHFNGSFFSLYHLLNRLTGFTLQDSNGNVDVSGRLLSINGVNLSGGGSPGAGNVGSLSGTVTATAYVLPAGQGLTAGASPAGPAGVGAPTAQPVAASPGAPAPAAAVARVAP